MNKGILALIILVALLVGLTPGIIGHLAEQSVNDSLEWADTENSEFSITTSEFDRGWFTSSGQHRIGSLTADLPVLVVDTRLDHGVIPISSMSRSNGSLMPGLGNAVSTLALELADGSLEPLPVTIYTNIGLSGALRAQLIVEASGTNTADARIDWGGSEFLVSSSPAAQSFGVEGAFTSLAVKSESETTLVGRLDIDLELAATPYGYTVGLVRVALDSLVVVDAENTMTVGPISIDSDSSIDDGRISGDLALSIENSPMPLGGTGGVELVARLENADAAAFGDLMRSIEAMQSNSAYEAALAQLEDDFLKLLANGMQLHIDQLDILSPYGQFTSRANATAEPSDDDGYTWTTAATLLAGSAELSFPKALVDMATQANPELHGVIGLGYVRKRDEFYVTEASVEAGVLTINGAPTPVPLSGL